MRFKSEGAVMCEAQRIHRSLVSLDFGRGPGYILLCEMVLIRAA